MFQINDYSIVALATPVGQSPLAIIRASGVNILRQFQPIFRSSKSILESPGNEIFFGYIYDHNTNTDIDQVLVSIFKNPKSFTGEDMVEINSHGNPIIYQKIIDLLIQQGCVMAQRGEFSYRSFLNQKIDLTQAEAIHDLIFSRSQKVSKIILESLKKNFYKNTQNIKNQILKLVAKIEVGIDYPEDDIEQWGVQDQKILKNLIKELQQLVKQSKSQKMAYQGYTVAIIGEPNAGKSSLLNILAGENKAIVSSIAGTTRDPIELSLNIDETLVTLIDTAGLREKADNEIEEQGIEKTQQIMLVSDFNILMVDSKNHNSNTLDLQIQKLQKENIPFIIVWNKSDLLEIPVFNNNIPPKNQIHISCKTLEGIDQLTPTIKNALIKNISAEDSQFFINQRQGYLLEQVLLLLQEVETIEQTENIELEVLSLLLQKALKLLGELDGSDIQDNILETIFSQFCVGK